METCICAEPIKECGRYPCGHILCSHCTLRMRTLMSDNTCPYCREEADKVAILTSTNKPFQNAKIPLNKYGIFCETDDLRLELLHLIKFPCPECDKEMGTLKALADHTQRIHKQSVCKVCAKHNFEFSSDFVLYSTRALGTHMKESHTLCEFCKWHFYSQDELVKHCREQHESCFICERQDPTRPQYFPDYERLEGHFMDKHYPCLVQQCLDDKFVVFGSKMEFQNHMLERHRELVGNVRQFQRITQDELDQSTQDPTASRETESPTEMALKRYTERLRIDANHDSGRIDQIHQANQTFEDKFVPVQAFIATYTSILKVEEDEITSLLQEFAKFTTLSENKQRQLDAALARRVAEASARVPSPSPYSAPSPTPSPGPSGPSRATPVPVSWGGRRAPGANGVLDLNNLPRLGESQKKTQARRPAFMNTPPAIAATPSISRPVPKKKPATPPQPWGQTTPGPQTRLPSLGNRGDHLAAWDAAGPSRGTASAPVTPGRSPVLGAGPGPSSSSSSSVSLNRLNTASLPSLPTRTQTTEKRTTKRIIRLV